MSGEAEHLKEVAQRRREARAERDEKILAAVRKRGEAYSVEIAEDLRVPLYKIATIHTRCASMEKAGLLESDLRTSKTHPGLVTSGTGRRYFRPVEAAEDL